MSQGAEQPETSEELDPSSLELRLALTLNGGVSLAVYIGGVVHELHRLTRKTPVGERGWSGLLEILKIKPVIDVISGTSAGGINGAALAVALANKNGDFGQLRDLWIAQGRMEAMLRQPFQKDPPSLLKGDEYFLPTLDEAFRKLARRFERSDCTLDLTITTTLLTPVTLTTVDSLGTEVLESQHAGLFHFRGSAASLGIPTSSRGIGSTTDHFAELGKPKTKDDVISALALASRATASFPVAFEPTFVPVNQCTDDRANMAEFADWKVRGRDCSRYGVDGGVLANTPTRPTLEAIQRMGVSACRVRRVLLLVHPHATDPATVVDKESEAQNPPTLLKSLSGVAGASSSVGSRSNVEEIERQNAIARSWRDGRREILDAFRDWESLRTAMGVAAVGPHGDGATAWWKLCYSLGKQRGVQLLVDPLAPRRSAQSSRVREAARNAIEAWDGELPFLPKSPPQTGTVPSRTRLGWAWGLDLAVGVATLAMQLAQQVLEEQGDAMSGPTDTARASTVAVSETVDVAEATKPVLRAYKLFVNSVSLLSAEADEQRRDALQRLEQRTDAAPDEAYFESLLEYYQSIANPETVHAPGFRVAHHVYAVGMAMCRLIGAVSRTDTSNRGSAVLRRQAHPFVGCANTTEMVVRLLTVEIAAGLVSAASTTSPTMPTTPIDLVQISAQVPQAFAPGFTADDKLAGMAMGRFSGFLKRSWRANDWTWGRLDGIKVLMLILLTPSRIRVKRTNPAAPEDEAEEIVAGLEQAVYPAIKDHSETRAGMRTDAVEAVRSRLGSGSNDAAIPALASYIAYGLQTWAIREEAPSLLAALADDAEEGAATAHGSFTRDVEKLLASHVAEADEQLLQLFAESGIGREPMADQLPSDLMIRTAATAAATSATMLSAPRSGLGVGNSIGRLMRGLIAVPYWAAAGLTQRGTVGRFLATVAMAVGVSLVALGLFGGLPAIVSTPITVLGVSATLAVFAYAALRAGSIVHGAAMLGLFIWLLPYGLHRSAETRSDEGAAAGTTAALSVVVLVIGTVVIANLRSPVRSPFAAADAVGAAIARRWKARRKAWWLWLVSAVGLFLIGSGAWVVVSPLVRDSHWTLCLTLTSVVVVVVVCAAAGWLGWRNASWLRPYGSADNRQLTDPTGLALAWSAVYGVGYSVLALASALWFGYDGERYGAIWLAPLVSLLLGIGFGVVAVVCLPWRREQRLIEKLASSPRVARSATPDAVKDPSVFLETVRRELLVIGDRSTYLHTPDGKGLSKWGADLARAIYLRIREVRPKIVRKDWREKALETGTRRAPNSGQQNNRPGRLARLQIPVRLGSLRERIRSTHPDT